LPVEASLLDWHIAPVQDRVLYHLKVTRKNSVSILFHRLFPNFTTRPVVMEEIWTSRIDGSQMHELGHVPLPAVVTDPRQSDSDDPKHELEKLQWLPDGKNISFIYHGTLYVVSAESKR
jgi:hypothetical protein